MTQTHPLAGAQGYCEGNAFTDLPSFDIFPFKASSNNPEHKYLHCNPANPHLWGEPVKRALLLSWWGKAGVSGCSANEPYFHHSTACRLPFTMDL